VLVTRHCEKDTAGDPRDPGLSEVGRKRAQVLARMLKDANVAQAFTSEFKRAQETAQQACATAERHVVSAGKPDELFAALDALAGGSVVLVVGHSNTTPAMLAHYGWKQMGADGKPVTAFPEDEFGALFAITVPPKGSSVAPTIVKLRYGD
jgi:broad specificity phosphatase PhoE